MNWTQNTKLSTKARIDLIYHIAKQKSGQKLDVTLKIKLCYEKFPTIYALWHQKTLEKAFPLNQQMLSITILSLKLILSILNKSSVGVNISSLTLNLKTWDTKFSIVQWRK